MAACGCVLFVAACATNSEAPEPITDSASIDLDCLLPSNCVNSLSGGSLPPLTYAGDLVSGLAQLRATLRTFPEAVVVRAGPMAIEAIFTTPIGFRDRVHFKIDAAEHRIDYSSRSTFGLFDFGKNRSRMQEFAKRFDRQNAT